MPSQETPGRFALPWHWLPLPPSKTKRPQAGEILKHVKEENHLAQSERLTHIQMQGSSNMPLYSIYIYIKCCQILSDITWPHLPESRHRYPPWSRDALPARCSVRSTCNGSSLQCTRRNHDASWLNQENSMMFERIWIRKTATRLKGHVNHWMLVDSRQNTRENNRSVKIQNYKCHSYPPCIPC